MLYYRVLCYITYVISYYILKDPDRARGVHALSDDLRRLPPQPAADPAVGVFVLLLT